MKNRIAKNLATMAGIALLGASANGFALGEANGQWFKLKFKTQNGLLVNIATGGTAKAKSTGTCYTQLVYTPNADPALPGSYLGDVICQDPSGAYVATTSGPDSIALTELPGGAAAYFIDNFVGYSNAFGHVVSGYSSQQATIKLNSAGTFKKGTIRSNGELVLSSLNPADPDLVLVGGYTVEGKSIPASKLPFTPF